MSHRIVIYGNAGCGKTTMARRLAEELALAHLDLDDIAWAEADPPTRRPLQDSLAAMHRFIAARGAWVIEGCYGDLIAAAASRCTELRFLNPGIEACVERCRARPWEPGKYATPQQQAAALEPLIEWVRRYETRDDEFSLKRHRDIFDRFQGPKQEII